MPKLFKIDEEAERFEPPEFNPEAHAEENCFTSNMSKRSMASRKKMNDEHNKKEPRIYSHIKE